MLLFERPRDVLDSSFDDWPFMSVHFWGERASGRWKLEILNAGVKRVNKAGKNRSLPFLAERRKILFHFNFHFRNFEKMATCVLRNRHQSYSFAFTTNTSSYFP